MPNPSAMSPGPELDRRTLTRRIGALLALFIVLNLALGAGLDFARRHCGKAESGVINAARAARPDILILGSSRAKSHYVDETLSGLWGARVFNAGEPGQGILFAEVVFEQVAATHAPRVVIFDVMSFAEEWNRLHTLDTWYTDSPRLRELYREESGRPGGDPAHWKTRLLLNLPTYRYANAFWKTIKDTRTPYARYGFLPHIPAEPTATAAPSRVPTEWLTEHIGNLARAVRASGGKLILVRSPQHDADAADAWSAPAEAAAKAYAIPYYRIEPPASKDSGDRLVFDDHLHLNKDSTGAFTRLLTRQLAGELPMMRP